MSDRDPDIQLLIIVLENAPRQGSDIDTPEGARYITISDTLAKKMAQLLRAEFLSDKDTRLQEMERWSFEKSEAESSEDDYAPGIPERWAIEAAMDEAEDAAGNE